MGRQREAAAVWGKGGERKRGWLDNGGAVASVLALQFASAVKTDEPRSSVPRQARMLGGHISQGSVCYLLGLGYAGCKLLEQNLGIQSARSCSGFLCPKAKCVRANSQ